MTMFPPIESLLETYDQPFFKKPALPSQSLLLQQQLADWIHQIYFDQKKLNELSVLRLIDHPLEAIKPNIKCSIMYSIIRQKVQQVCKSIRQLIIDSYRKLHFRKQTNCDLKHSSDGWNVNFSKFRKGNLQTSMNKVYGPIAHIICTYHNSLLDCNKEVYDLWKLLYQCSDVKDLEFKTLQGSLNELILEELMQEYPNSEMAPKDVMPTLSSIQKHQFIFKEMWGFQKRKLAVQFSPKNQQFSTDSPQKQRQNNLMNDQNMPKRVQKGQALSPPKPIPLSVKQIGVNTVKAEPKVQNKFVTVKQLAKKKAMQDEIQFLQLEEQFSGLDSQTRIKILQHLYDFKQQPSSTNRQKQETLKTIEKIILNNLTPTEKQSMLQNPLMDPMQGPLQIELQEQQEELEGNFQQSQQDEQGQENHEEYYYEESQEVNEENESDDLMVRMKLRKLKEIQDFEKFSKEWRHKRLQDTRDQEMRARQTGERYLKLCERLQKIRKTYKTAGMEFKDPQIQKALNQATLQAKLVSEEIQEIQQALPELIPINFRKAESLKESAQKFLQSKKNFQFQRQLCRQIPNTIRQKQSNSSNSQKADSIPCSSKQSIIQKQSQRASKFLQNNPTNKQRLSSQNFETSRTYNLRLDDYETNDLRKQELFKKIKECYDINKESLQDLDYCEHNREEKQRTRNSGNGINIGSSNIAGKKSSLDSDMLFGRKIDMSSLADLISDKGKSISHSFQSSTSNTNQNASKFSSKLQNISRQQILDQIYEVAKEKQKRQKKGHNIRKDIKLTYKKISYEVRSGDDRNEIKITKGELTTDDFNWFDDLSDKAKYHLGEGSEYGEKLIDEPNEDICQEEKQEKKKKKKKKKKNKQKKQLSEENEKNLEKASNSSMNDEQEDLEPLNEFKKRSISDLFNLRKMMGWPEGQSLLEYIESSEILERQKEQQLLMEKKIEIYEKNGQSKKEKSKQKDRKAVSKENKNKREIYNEDQMKLFQFLQNLEIKDDNRDKCIVSEQTLQRIIMKRKQIKSMEIFEKLKMQRTESVNHSNVDENTEGTPVNRKSDFSNPKASKPKNKKKKK